MADIENSEVVKQVLTKLIDITKRKSSEGHVINIMNSLLKELKDDYNFLKHVEIKDTRFLEDAESVSVMSDLNSIPPDKIGKALRTILISMNRNLGRDAGHFMLKELRRKIDDNYHTVMMNGMGLDLSLLQLEYEVSIMEQNLENK